MPIDFKYLASPIPETWSKCGVPIAPAHKIISLFAKISNILLFYLHNKPTAFLFLNIIFKTVVFFLIFTFSLFKAGFKKAS